MLPRLYFTAKLACFFIFFFASSIRAVLSPAQCARLAAQLKTPSDVVALLEEDPDKALAMLRHAKPPGNHFDLISGIADKYPPKRWSKYVKDLKLSKDQRASLASVAASQDLLHFVQHAENFELPRSEIARRIATNANSHSTAYDANRDREFKKIVQQVLKMEFSKQEILRIAKGMGSNLSKEGPARLERMLELLRNDGRFSAKDMADLADFLLKKDPSFGQYVHRMPLSAEKRLELEVAQTAERFVTIEEFFDLKKEGGKKYLDALAELAKHNSQVLLRPAKELGISQDEHYRLWDELLNNQNATVPNLQSSADWPDLLRFSDPARTVAIWKKLIRRSGARSAHNLEFNPRLVEKICLMPLDFSYRQEILSALLEKATFSGIFSLDVLHAERLKSEKERWELLQTVLVNAPGDMLGLPGLVRYLNSIPSFRNEALIAWAKSGGKASGSSLIRGLPVEQVFRMLEAQASHDFNVKDMIEGFPLNQAQRAAVAMAAVKSAGRRPKWDYNAGHKISDVNLSTRQKEKLAAELAFLRGRYSKDLENEDFIEDFGLPLKARGRVGAVYLAAFAKRNHPFEEIVRFRDEIAKLEGIPIGSMDGVLLSHYPEAVLDLSKQASSSTLNDDPEGLSSLIQELKAHGEKHPEVLSPSWVPILWDRVRKRTTGLRLLQYLYSRNHFNVSKSIPQDSADIFAKASGIPLNAARADALENTVRLGTLYELGLDISSSLTYAPFKTGQIAPELLAPKEIAKLNAMLHRARDLQHAYGSGESAWEKVQNGIRRHGDRITRENVEAISRELEAEIARAIEDAFKGAEVEFSYKQFEQLKEKWKNLEPVFTLVARYQGTLDWRREIPILAKIFNAELTDQFTNLKFRGDPNDRWDRLKAEDQLKMLKTEEQKQQWQKIRSRVALVSQEGDMGPTTAELLANGQQVIRDNFFRNAGVDAVSVPDIVRAQIESALSQRGDLSKKLEQVLSGNVKELEESERSKVITKALADLVMNTKDLEQAQWAVSALGSWAKHLGIGGQAREDIESTSRKLKPADQKRGRRIAFTTTFHDAKTLLRIGDLVKTSSCQNYKTGCYVETLPAYVIDANIVGLAGFSIEPAHFRNQRDFDALEAALREGIDVKGAWDGGSQQITFSLVKNGLEKTFTTAPMEHAHLRHVMKLGTTDNNKPGARYEPAYQQDTPGMKLMHDQAEAILHQTNEEIDGDPDGKITVEATRNGPGGAYTDLGGGVRKDSYQIRGVRD